MLLRGRVTCIQLVFVGVVGIDGRVLEGRLGSHRD